MRVVHRVLGRGSVGAAVLCALALAAGLGREAPIALGGTAGATDQRAEISTAFAHLFTGRLDAVGASRFVQAGGAALAASLDGAFESFIAGFTQGAARPSVGVTSIKAASASVAGVGFEVRVGYRGGVYRQDFTGAAVHVGGRWKVGWVTACFVAESYDARCPQAPRGAAILPLPTSPLPARFALPSAVGLIRPASLAVAADGGLLILDALRDQVFRLDDGQLQLVAGTGARGFAGDGGPATAAEFTDPSGVAAAPDGTIYVADTGNGRVRAIAPDGTISTLAAHLPQPSGIALARDGTLYVADGNDIATISPNGAVRTFAIGKGRFNQVTIGAKDYGAFNPERLAIDGAGDVYAFSFSPKLIFEFSPTGQPLRAWTAYADGLATAPDGSVVVASHGATLARIQAGRISTIVDFSKATLAGFPPPRSGLGVFQPDGVAVAPDGTIYTDTDVGNGYTDQTALAALPPAGSATILSITTPLANTLPALGSSGFPSSLYPAALPARAGNDPVACPSPQGLRPFDRSARTAAIDAAKQIDLTFHNGLRLSDRAWWPGYYSDQIDGLYQGGRHSVARVQFAVDDIYAPAVSRACGASLVRDSLVIVVGRSDYSDQVSHLYFLDRDGRALLYWQHT